MNKKTIFVFLASALLVAGCGGSGGGGSSSSSSSTSSSSITTSTTPTAKFSTSSQSSADSLTNEIQNGTPALVSASSMQNIPGAVSALPTGIGSLPAGVTGSYNCSTLGSSGSGTVSYDTNYSSTPTAGSYINMTFTNCSFVINTTTFTLNGSSKLTYSSYTSSSDYAASISYSSYYISIVDSTNSVSNSYGPLSGTFNVADSGGVYSFDMQLANGGATNIAKADVTYSGTDVTISSATYVYNSSSAGGIIKVVYSNWKYDTSTGFPVSGTITVTDADGNTVVMTANGDNTVTVTYTISGTVTAWTVTF